MVLDEPTAGVSGTGRGHGLGATRCGAWADSYVTREDACASGCSFGSLAAEIMKSDLDVHDEVAAGPERGAGIPRRRD